MRDLIWKPISLALLAAALWSGAAVADHCAPVAVLQQGDVITHASAQGVPGQQTASSIYAASLNANGVAALTISSTYPGQGGDPGDMRRRRPRG